jgi:nucleoside-diphosphate kinase
MVDTVERTFIMIKPDGFLRGLVAPVMQRFTNRGYKLIAMKMMVPSAELVTEHYSDLKEKKFFPGLVKHVSSAPVVAMVWEGKDIVRVGRVMVGETDPLKSLPGSIRGDYCIDTGRNIIHASDLVQNAQAEILLWFKTEELCVYTRPDERSIYE